ncbi:MAG: hypothetical protein PHQ28_00090 [Mycobacterium sp.]|nr:hypothetical protein [Mycobacterium sp.]
MTAQLHDSVALELDPEFRDNYWRARQNGRVVEVQHDDPSLVYIDWGDDGINLAGAQLTGTRERWNVGLLRVTHVATRRD